MSRSSLNSTAPLTANAPESASHHEQPHPSAMRLRFNAVAEFVARTVFSRVVVNEAAVAKIRELASCGTVIYALRNRSLVDYFLINYVLRREGLPLPVYVNGISAAPLVPLCDMFAIARDRVRQAFGASMPESAELDHDYCARAVTEGKPVLIFMRGRRTRGVFGRWMRRPVSSRVGSDFFREIVQTYAEGERERFIVPLAPFRGHSFHRRATGISALVYSVHEVPSDTRKLLTYFWNRARPVHHGRQRSLPQRVPIALRTGHRGTHRPPPHARDADLSTQGGARRARAGTPSAPANQGPRPRERGDNATESAASHKRAEPPDRESCARRPNGISKRWRPSSTACSSRSSRTSSRRSGRRMFTGLRRSGFETVVEKVAHHPMVLVPCHRSHFDYLITDVSVPPELRQSASHRRRRQHGVLADERRSFAHPAPTSSDAASPTTSSTSRSSSNTCRS